MTDYSSLDLLLTFFEYVLKIRDPYETGHSVRVAWLALDIAKSMGIEQQNVVEIWYGARFHDVGKIALPVALLQKKGRITKNEMLTLRSHVHLGLKLFEQLKINGQIWDVIAGHHENYDGSGYPLGLSNGSISVGAKIVQVCDRYDAITSMRAYSPAKSKNDALIEMDRFTQQYDPEIYKVFKRQVKYADYKEE